MVPLSTRRNLIAPFALLGFMLAVAGCQSGDGATGLGLGLNSGPKPAEATVTESELRMACPRVTLREGTSILRTYARGGDGDPAKLYYQTTISDVTRACRPASGSVQMNVAVAGRIIAGPLGAGGNVDLPIRIAIMNGDEVVYSQVYKHPVAVTAGQATQFIFNDPNIVVPNEIVNQVQIFAGFDEGPKKAN